jgi:hypothetical protein
MGALLLSTGCDSIPQTQNEDAAALFTGTWPMLNLSDDVRDIDVESIDTVFEVVFKFRVNFTFELEVESEAAGINQRLTGEYVISDDSFIISLDTSVPGVGKVPLIFAYEFKGEGAPEDGGPNELFLYTEGDSVDSLNTILGSDLEGVVVMKYTITSRLT